MIRRPLSERFADKVLAGIKTTTIRDNPWPVGKPIMLFRWSGAAYRSKQVEIAPVVVESTESIEITCTAVGVAFWNADHDYLAELWESEGFHSQADMDAWFEAKMKPGETVTKSLMRFRLATPEEGDVYRIQTEKP